MSETVFNVVMIFLFILIGGVFAAAEMAVVGGLGISTSGQRRPSAMGRDRLADGHLIHPFSGDALQTAMARAWTVYQRRRR
jgi:hypothetical protein